MRRADDSSLTSQQYARVRAEAERALSISSALGRFPTPVHDIMAAADVEEVPEDVLNEGFLATLRRKAGTTLKRALSKVIGVFDARSKLIFIDRSLHVVKQRFVRLHETGHGFLGWQRDVYSVVEDCEQTIAPEVADLFDREANVFASEVLFQLDAFTEEASQHAFGIGAPLKIGRKFGASAYASIRRYVTRHSVACVVLVLEPPRPVDGRGYAAELRRAVGSPRFQEMFGEMKWPDEFTPSDPIGRMVPLGKRRMSSPRSLELVDLAGGRHECIAEAFATPFQVFVLIHAEEALRPIVVASTA